jgi:hypothetical protein
MVFTAPMMLVVDLQTDAVLTVLKGGLEDLESIDVGGLTFFFLFIPNDQLFYLLFQRSALYVSAS